jgi:hypothetical protein
MASNDQTLQDIYNLLPDNSSQEISAKDERDSFQMSYEGSERTVVKLRTAADLAANNANIYEESLVLIHNDIANNGLYLSTVNQPTTLAQLKKSTIEVIDNLTSTDPNSALSAKQGKELQDTKEALLGNPSTDGFVLSSTTSGVRTWVDNTEFGGRTWSDTKNYLTGDVITHNGNLYYAKQDNHNEDPTNNLNYWIFVTPEVAGREWTSTVQYLKGDLVTKNGITYLCITNNSNVDPVGNPNFWTLPSGLEFGGRAWETSSEYKIGDTVSYSNIIYIALTDNDGKQPDLNNTDWVEAGWDHAKYAGGWTHTTYKPFTIVRDGSWTMISNKETTEKAAPILIGNEMNINSANIDSTESYNGIVKSGNEYSFNKTGFITEVSYYAPTISPNISHTLVIDNVSRSVRVLAMDGIVTTACSWETKSLCGVLVNSGEQIRAYLVSINST